MHCLWVSCESRVSDSPSKRVSQVSNVGYCRAPLILSCANISNVARHTGKYNHALFMGEGMDWTTTDDYEAQTKMNTPGPSPQFLSEQWKRECVLVDVAQGKPRAYRTLASYIHDLTLSCLP